MEINCRIQESTGAIAYQIDLPKADLIFRGSSLKLLIVFIRNLFSKFVNACIFIYRKRRYELDCGCSFGKEITAIAIYICVKWYDKS